MPAPAGRPGVANCSLRWFDQTLDHFGFGEPRTFRQRVFTHSAHWRAQRLELPAAPAWNRATPSPGARRLKCSTVLPPEDDAAAVSGPAPPNHKKCAAYIHPFITITI